MQQIAFLNGQFHGDGDLGRRARIGDGDFGDGDSGRRAHVDDGDLGWRARIGSM